MAAIKRNTQLFRRILRLRRAERAHPDDRDIATVRAEIERELGDVITRSMAARLLGVHHSSLQRWIDSDDLPVVMDKNGRRGIPISAVAALHEALHDEAKDDQPEDRTRQHRIEPLVLESRRYAEQLDPRRLIQLDSDQAERQSITDDRHRRADRRSLAYHRAIAKRLRRPMVDAARRQIWQWQREGRIDDRYAEAWLDVLDRPVLEVKRELAADTPMMRDLRQSSPFAGTLTEAERRKIFAEIR
ncbi:MAG TPA: hypothetical protein VJ741_01910 [Solirubrobacteraceae bacterium]|nr:hypothetical protein [Solirubrobacteraceae bacterium]